MKHAACIISPQHNKFTNPQRLFRTMHQVIGVILLGVVLPALTLPNNCPELYKSEGLSTNFNETIAHAIHSFTVNDLRKFNPAATVNNGVPVVNPRLNDPTTNIRVLSDAPMEFLGNEFDGETMNTIDMILTQIGQPTDGLGANWSPLERIVHKFHMKDLWAKMWDLYITVEMPSTEVCECMMDTKKNGIYDAVDWIARHYKSGTPITLLNRPIPKLTDAKSWAVWKVRLLHYYNSQAIIDAIKFLRCALPYM